MIKNVDNKLVGKKVKITPLSLTRYSYRDYGIEVNQPLYIISVTKKTPVNGSTIKISNNPQGGAMTLSVRIDDVELSSSTLNDFEEEILALHKELENIQNKIDFMKENKLDEFDEEEYSLFTLLSLFKEEKITDNQKIKKIKEFLQTV